MQWQRVERGMRRGVRFPIVVPLRYRPAAESEWCEGESVNISGSGVLFRAERPLELLTPIEITLTLPVRAAGSSVRFDLRGEIVRVLEPQIQESRAFAAATIIEYRFVREGEPESNDVSST